PGNRRPAGFGRKREVAITPAGGDEEARSDSGTGMGPQAKACAAFHPHVARRIFNPAPCPGFESIVRSPPSVRTRRLMLIGPRCSNSSSSSVYLPLKSNPLPLSSTLISIALSDFAMLTATRLAEECFCTL